MCVLQSTTVKEPGRYYLQCNTGSVQMYPNPNNNNNGQASPGLDGYPISFSTAQNPILSQIFVPNQCFIFITSSDFPNGDLFSYIYPITEYTALAQGSNESPAVASAYFAVSFISFDYGSKTFTISTQTNLTVNTVTGVEVVSNVDQHVVCSQTWNPTAASSPTTYNYLVANCYMNATDIPSLASGQLYVNFITSTHTNGELRGAITPAGFSSGPSSLALGLGIGLGVGIPVAAGAGVGLFFLIKHFGGSMASSSKI